VEVEMRSSDMELCMRDFIVEHLPSASIVLDENFTVIYSNKKAAAFLLKHGLPEEITSVGARMFEAYAAKRYEKSFPGEIHMRKRLDGVSNDWIFKLDLFVGQEPCLLVTFRQQRISGESDLAAIGEQFRLSERQKEVLVGVLQSMSNMEISEKLGISEQRVKDHLSNVYMKTGLKRRHDLLIYLAGRGIRNAPCLVEPDVAAGV
jgi:DNA-binding CsgD family transcriptional regulator